MSISTNQITPDLTPLLLLKELKNRLLKVKSGAVLPKDHVVSKAAQSSAKANDAAPQAPKEKAEDRVVHSVKESKETQKALLADLNARLKPATAAAVAPLITAKVEETVTVSANPCLFEENIATIQSALEAIQAFMDTFVPESDPLPTPKKPQVPFTPLATERRPCIEEQSLIGLQAANRIITACQDKKKHGPYLAHNAFDMVNIGETLLRNLYAIEDRSKLSCNGVYNKLPEWLNLVDDRFNFFNLFKLQAESENTNGFFSSIASMTNKLNLVSKAQQGLSKCVSTLNPFADTKVADEHARLKKHYLSAIMCMMWALYAKVASKNRDFLRGSYKIIDPDLRLNHCLLEYVKFATKNDDPIGVLPSGMAIPKRATSPTYLFNTSSAFAYSRPNSGLLPLSSHYADDPEQWGIDMRFEEADLAIPLLPGQMCHILFGVVKSEQAAGYPRATFIKFEPDPLGNSVEVLKHGVSLVQSHHVEEGARREKDIDPDLIKIFAEFTHYAEIPVKKGKRPIQTMVKMMDEAINKLDQNTKDMKNLAERHTTLIGIRQRFMTAATEKGLDYLDIRTGNEEIINFSSYKPTHAASDAGIVHSPIKLNL